MKESIHNYDKRLNWILNKIKRSESISVHNKSLILKHKGWLFLINLSKGRVIKCLYYLFRMAEWMGKNFDEANKEDMEALVVKINESQYVPFSKNEYKTTLKRFYRWLRDVDEDPPEVSWIKPANKGIERIKLPDEILTEEDIKKMILATQNIRNKAFIATLFNSGFRVGELLFSRIKHIVFQDNNTARMFVDGKTGKRWTLLISCVPYLQEWLNKHPAGNDPEAYIWVRSNKRLICYNTVRQILQQTAKKAGITKKVNPHAFRHGSATLYANHLTEAQMKHYFGWKQSSKMAAIYVHISGRDVDNAMLQAHGLESDGTSNKVRELASRICPRCNDNNPGENKFCKRCGMPLDQETRVKLMEREFQRKEADNILDELVKDPEFKAYFMEKIRNLAQVKNRA